MDDKLRRAQTDLGFLAAELRGLSAALADACARYDVERVCDAAEEMQEAHLRFRMLYTKVLLYKPARRLDLAERISL